MKVYSVGRLLVAITSGDVFHIFAAAVKRSTNFPKYFRDRTTEIQYYCYVRLRLHAVTLQHPYRKEESAQVTAY